MELRHARPPNRARPAWPLAGIGLAVGALLVAGPAQAGPDAVAGHDAAKTASTRLAASDQRLERTQARNAVSASTSMKLTVRLARQSRQVNRLAREAERLAARAERAERGSTANGQGIAEVRNAAGEPLALTDDACERNVAHAGARGLRLPDGWAIHCVGPGLDWEGGSHWGVTCPYDECPEGDGPYVSISNPTYYVVAHELCHANFGNDELMADACAAEHGASLEASPYG